MQTYSSKERRLWIISLIVFLTIYATIPLGGHVAIIIQEIRVLNNTFFYIWLVMVAGLFLSGISSPESKFDFWIIPCLVGFFGLIVLRMDLNAQERSHMFEYSFLVILILFALRERQKHTSLKWSPYIMALVITGSIGILDELLQLLVPVRVFDPIDIGFNLFAVAGSLFAYWVLTKIRKLFEKIAN